jgi:hypothetical protein
MDVRTFKGANVDSDHYLVGAKIRARISNSKKLKAIKRKWYRTSQLGNDKEIKKLYASKIEEYLSQHPYGQGTTVDEEWEVCKDIIQTAAEEIIGKEIPTSRNPWYDSEYAKITAKKNEAYRQTQQKHRVRNTVLKYQEKRRSEKKIHRRKEREKEKKQLEELVDLHSSRETRQFYQKINQSRKEFKPNVTLCKDKDGNIMSDPQDILA